MGVDRAPMPDGMTAADFKAILQEMRSIRQREYDILRTLAKAERNSVWVEITGIKPDTRRHAICRLRKKGFRIDKTTTVKLGTWRWTRRCDVSPLTQLMRAPRWEPLSQAGVYRFNPKFMRAFRVFIRNYRESGGYIVHMWERGRLRRYIKLTEYMGFTKKGCLDA